MSLGITEIVLILVVVLVLFGGKKIPELARSLGRAKAEYKKAKESIEKEVSAFNNETDKTCADTEKSDKQNAQDTTEK